MSSKGAEWTLIKHEGRDYVTLRNVAQFYGLGDFQPVSNDFNIGSGQRKLRGQVGSGEFYINNLKFILSYPVAEQKGEPLISRMDLTKVLEPVLRPSRIKNAQPIRTIVLDAGHGGHDKGATNQFGCEKDYTLDVVKRAKADLEKLGYRVALTRSGDYFVPLEERTRIANRYPDALFISIHFNSGGNQASGLEVFTLAPRGVPSMAADGPRLSDLNECPGNRRDAENIALATATHAAIVGRSQMFDRGIKRARFVVIRDVTIPGVLIEGGFLSNSGDARLVASGSYRQLIADSITGAVNNYQRAVNSQPAPAMVKSELIKSRDSGLVDMASSAAPESTHDTPATPPSAN